MSLRPLLRTQDGSIVSADGRVLFFSAERFARDICEGKCCFLCGAYPADAEFNDEHILPNWVLRRFKLHGHTIVLPNGRTHRYGSYTIPCCVSCNSLLGDTIEAPLSQVLAGGHEAVCQHIQSEGSYRLFVWLALIFLKMHLKDASLREHANHKDGDATIAAAAEYAWGVFHHLHCLVRSVYTRAAVAPEAYGSLVVLSAGGRDTAEDFDLIDLSAAQTLVIRMGNFALCAVFDDSCAVINGLKDVIERIEGSLSFIQIREFAAHMACCNLHLQNRPQFRTCVENATPPRVSIAAHHDASPSFATRDKNLFGHLMERVLHSSLAHIHVEGRTPEELAALVRAGEISFLFDDDGRFIART